STITLKLDQGGGQPVTTIGSYQHTIAKNIPPDISALGTVTVTQGTTRVLLFSVESNFWPPERLAVQVVDYPTNLIAASALRILGTGTNRALFLTPALNQIGTGSIRLRVTDGSGDTADSTLDLTVASNRQPVSVLGAGSALAVNPGVGE